MTSSQDLRKAGDDETRCPGCGHGDAKLKGVLWGADIVQLGCSGCGKEFAVSIDAYRRTTQQGGEG